MLDLTRFALLFCYKMQAFASFLCFSATAACSALTWKTRCGPPNRLWTAKSTSLHPRQVPAVSAPAVATFSGFCCALFSLATVAAVVEVAATIGAASAVLDGAAAVAVEGSSLRCNFFNI